MNTFFHLFIRLALLLGAFAPAWAGESASSLPDGTRELQVGTIDGGQFDLAAQRGKWVIVNFWATWCSPCLKEMPDLDAFVQARKDVAMVGLAYEDIGSEEMKAFLVEHPVSYPIAIIDVFDPPAAFPAPRGLPTTWLIDPQGVARKRFLGPVTARELEQEIPVPVEP